MVEMETDEKQIIKIYMLHNNYEGPQGYGWSMFSNTSANNND